MDPAEEEVKSPPCPWRVEEADEARYNFSDQKGVWQPKPEDILSVFEQLSKGGALPLKWTCPGRKEPESDTPNENETEMEMEITEDQKKEDLNDPEPSAFDFDDSLPDTNTKVTPWRAHAGIGRTPKTEKRVARMDNIMDSLRKQQIQRAAEREARKSKGSTPTRVQQGRGRLIKFGSPLSKKIGSAPPISSLFSAPSPPDPMVTSSNTGIANTSPSATAVSSMTVTQSNMNSAPANATTPALAVSPSAASGSTLQRQDMKNNLVKETTSDGLQKSEEKDSRHEENIQPTSAASVSSSSSTLESSHPSFVTISSDVQKRHTATAGALPGLEYQSSEQKFKTSAFPAVTSEDPILTAATSDDDVKVSSKSASPLAAGSSPFSSNSSVPPKTPTSNSNGSASKPSSSSSSYPNTTLTKTEESTAESSLVVTTASESMTTSVNESVSGQLTSFVAPSPLDAVTQSSAQTDQVKTSESNSFPLTVNPSQASALTEPSLPKLD